LAAGRCVKHGTQRDSKRQGERQRDITRETDINTLTHAKTIRDHDKKVDWPLGAASNKAQRERERARDMERQRDIDRETDRNTPTHAKTMRDHQKKVDWLLGAASNTAQPTSVNRYATVQKKGM
jgi:hypothetical protein